MLPALLFWLNRPLARRRPSKLFAISKDGKCDDYIDRPCSLHYWERSAAVLVALQHNSLFEVVGSGGSLVVVQQDKGLPIGRHLSAAVVELTSCVASGIH